MANVAIPEWTLADHLRKARQTTGLNQREFAERLGVKYTAYAQWEADNNRPRDVVMVAKRVEMLTGIYIRSVVAGQCPQYLWRW